MYESCNNTIFSILSQELVEPPAYSIIPAILEAGIEVHISSGNDDMFLNHFDTELAIQNMTWYGHQGLQEKPDRQFVVDGTGGG